MKTFKEYLREQGGPSLPGPVGPGDMGPPDRGDPAAPGSPYLVPPPVIPGPAPSWWPPQFPGSPTPPWWKPYLPGNPSWPPSQRNPNWPGWGGIFKQLGDEFGRPGGRTLGPTRRKRNRTLNYNKR